MATSAIHYYQEVRKEERAEEDWERMTYQLVVGIRVHYECVWLERAGCKVQTVDGGCTVHMLLICLCYRI